MCSIRSQQRSQSATSHVYESFGRAFHSVPICVLCLIGCAAEAHGQCSTSGSESSCARKMQRVAVVTGANRGIGLEVVSGLLSKLPADFDIILTGRSESMVAAAVQCLRQRHYGEGTGNTCCQGVNAGIQPCEFGTWFYTETGAGSNLGPSGAHRLRSFQLDLNFSSSIQALGKHLRDTYGGVDILINNGAAPSSARPKEHLDIDYFGHLSLSKEVLPLLRSGARVVNVGSEAGSLREFASPLRMELLDDSLTESRLNEMLREYLKLVSSGRQQSKGWPGGSGYAVAKAANGAMTRIHAKNFAQYAPASKDVLINACCPGPANAPHCQKGAHVIVYLATLPAEDSRSGRWFVDRGWTGQPWEADW